jgi:hypothetical protein
VVTRWQVTKAVRASALPSSSRLIMLTLADVAEVGTAEIPPKYTPSLSVLVAETGLSRSGVKDHLNRLESDGWVVRSRPDAKAQWHGERTQYRLDIPVGQEAAEGGPDEDPVGHTETQGGPGDDPGVGREVAEPRPLDGHLETDHSDLDQINVRSRPTRASNVVAIPERTDVEQVCRHLADRIEANGSKRPTITKAWRDAARRLIDKDGRTVEQIVRAIDWCQDDDFWRPNIMSMPKLREKYDQLRLQAARTSAPKPATSDQRFAAAMALKGRFGDAS